ncbi:MAG: S8 family serine peptidase [Candidatus Altimarinota bacterium]
MSHFFRRLTALAVVFQMLFTSPGMAVFAQELTEDPPEVLEEVIQAEVVDDGLGEELVEEEEVMEEQEPVGETEESSSSKASEEEVSDDDGVEDEVEASDQEVGDLEGDEAPVEEVSDEQALSEDGEESEETDLDAGSRPVDADNNSDQNSEIEQNVQNIDELTEELLVPDFSEVLERLEQALADGTLSRDDRAGMVAFLESLQATDEMVQKLLDRFPVRDERELKRSTVQISKGIIPPNLLRKARQDLSRSGVSTQSIETSLPVEYVSDRILVKVSSAAVADQWIAQASAQNLEIVRLLDGSQPLLKIDALDDRSTIDLLQQYISDPNVVYQEPDYVYRTEAVPNDSTYGFQWHHRNTGGNYFGFVGPAGEDIQSQDAWDIFTGNGNTIIAVIDTGVMYTHPDLQNRMWNGSAACVDHNGAALPGACPNHGYDYFDNDDNPIDEANHGTLVAGSAAAHGNNGVGVAGVNWNGKIMALKAGTADSNILLNSSITNGIYFAVRNGAKILNMSFSSSGESTGITNAINFARTNGVLVLAAAGNNSLNLDLPGQDAFPCETNLDNILCIASTNLQGTLQFLGGTATSNYGQTAVDVAAPGSLIVSTAPTQTDLYNNAFENGATDVGQFTLTGSSGWGLKDTGSNKLLTTHTLGSYGNNESTTASINQDFNLSSYRSGTLLFEMSCLTDNTFDAFGKPVDGVAIDFSHNGGTSYEEVTTFNGTLTTQRGQVDVGPNGLPLITIGLNNDDFVSQFRFRFRFFSNATNTGTGCEIDEIRLRVTSGATYLITSGTSFATPITAGLASLIWEYDPTLTYQQVMQQILAGGETLASLTGTTVSGKRINSYRSLALMTDPAVQNLRAFLSNGGTEFFDGNAVSTASPFFSWIAPTGQGIISGYSYAVDGVPDAVVDTTATSVSLSGLSEGPHTFQIFGINDVGTVGTVAVLSFTVDTVAPNAPTLLLLNTNGFVNLANQSASTLSGSAPEGALLEYSISDGNMSVTGSQSVSSGAFSISSVDLDQLADGSLTISATLRDAAGNISSAGTGSATKDTQITPPTQLQLNGGMPINAATPNSVDLTFTTIEAGSAVYTISNGIDADLLNTVSVSGAGTTTVSINHNSLSDATLTIEVLFTDTAGNPAASVQTTLVKDTNVLSVAQVQLNAGVGVNASNVGSSTLSFEAFEIGIADYVISDGSAPDVSGTVNVNAAGIISISNLVLTGLDDGSLTVTVGFTDTVGNEAADAMVSVPKDTTVSPATNVQLNNGNTILKVDQTEVDLTFQTTEAGSATYTITDTGSGVITATVPVTAAGTTTVQGLDVSGLADGTLSLSVVFTDLVGNSAAAGTGSVLKDSIVMAPTNVQLNGSVTISAATQTSVDLTFETTEAGSASYTISKDAGSITGSVNVLGAGTTTVADLDVTSLGDGTLTLSVIFTDTPGNVSAAGTGTVEKDTTVIPAASVRLNNGAGVNQATVLNSSLMFETTESGNATYVISNGTASDLTGSVSVTASGTTTVSNLDLTSFGDGLLNLSVVFTDTVGNTAAAGVGTAQKDIVVNPATNVQLNGGVTIIAATEASVNLTFSTDESGSITYTISDGGATQPLTGTQSVAGGPVTIAGLDVRSLANGTLTISVIFTDGLGNEAAAGIGTVLKDSVIPLAPQNVQLNGGVTINADTADSVSITGTVNEPGTLLYAIVDGDGDDVNGSMVVAASGPFTISGIDVSSLSDGTLTVYVTLTDVSGNTSLDENNTVLKDVVFQAATNVALNGGVTINASTHTGVALSFQTIEAGSAQYSIFDGTDTLSGSVAVVAAGTTTVSNIDVSGLTDNVTLQISVVFTDSAGNTAAAGTGTVLKDAVIPQAPQNVQLNGGVTIVLANQTSVFLTGTVGEGGMLSYVISDGVHADITGTQSVGVGAFTVTGLNVSSLSDGTLNISVRVTDDAGNQSAAGTAIVSKDTDISVVTNVQLNGGVTINEGTQTSVNLTFVGVESGSASYTITAANGSLTDTVSVSGSGTTTVSGLDVSSLADGTLNLSVDFTDTAGNVAAAGTGSVQKDTVVAAPQNVELNDLATINENTEASVTLEGTVAEDGQLSYVISDGSDTVSDTVPVTSGAFSISGIDVSGLDDGPLTVSVTLTDNPGNLSATTQVMVQKDTLIADPTSLVINAAQPVTSANQTQVTFAFSVTETGAVDYEFTDGTDMVSGTRSISSTGVQNVTGVDVSTLDEGTLTLTIRFRDDAGNVAGDVSGTILKDTIANTPTNFIINGNQAVNLANQSLVYFRANFSETGTMDYEFTDGTDTLSGTTTISSTGVVTVSNVDLALMDEGLVSGSITFTDALGNVSLTVSGTANKDTLVNSAAQVILNAGTTIAGETANSVTLSFIVVETGTVNYTITDENNDSVTGTYVVSTVGTVVISGIDVSSLADGLLIPAIMFIDDAGNGALTVRGAAIQKTDQVADGAGRRRRFFFQDDEPVVSSGGGGGGGSSSSTVSPAVTTTPEVLSESTARSELEELLRSEGLMSDEKADDNEDLVLPFVDLVEGDEVYDAVRYLYGRDIVRGQGNGSRFDGKGVVDWAQALKMLLLVSEQEVDLEVDESPFPEVEANAWFAPYFDLAKRMGYVNGGPKGSVIPWQAMNRAEAVVLVYRIFGLQTLEREASSFDDVEAGVWFSDAVHDAVERGLLSVQTEGTQRLLNPTALMTREEFVRLIVGLWLAERS